MGDDLDAALSTVLYLQHNPNARLAGIYAAYSKLFLCPEIDFQQLDQCVFIDLDIFKAECRSLGHHIVRQNKQDVLAGFRNSCNMNEWEKRSLSVDFSKKYPLGTVHFLMWLYDVAMPFSQYGEQLIWLADSAFINGQSHRFRENVTEWLFHRMPAEALQVSFHKIETEQFEDRMEKLQSVLRQHGFNQGHGQVQSKHRHLFGYQCQPTGEEDAAQMTQYIKRLLDVIAALTGWAVPKAQLNIDTLHTIVGTRRKGSLEQILGSHSLDTFLNQKNVFSYVFPFKEQINYTCFTIQTA